MKHFIFAFFTIFTVVGITTNSYSIEREVNQDSVKYHFKPVVVTGQRYKMAQQDVAASISVIEAPTLRKTNIQTVMDAVSYMTPGVFTTRKSNMGYGVSTLAAGGVTIRGLGGKPNSQVLVLIDGRPDFQGIFSHPISDAYPLDNIDHVEVLRGPASVVYGTNALGGVINIITKDVDTIKNSSHVNLSYGSFNTQKYTLQNMGRAGKLAYSLSMSHQQSDGHRKNSNFNGQHYALKLSYSINNHFDISFNGNMTPYEFNDPGPKDIDLMGYFDFGNITRSSADLTLRNNHTNTDGIIKIHGNFGEHELSDGWYSKDQTNGVLAYQNFKLIYNIQTTVGFDAKRFGGTSKSNNTKLGTFFNDELATYLHLQKTFQDKFIIDSGIRLENNSHYGWQQIPRLGMVFHADKNLSFRASASKGFRSPSIRDLYLFNPANVELEPEELINYEVGFNSSFATGYNLDLSTFYYEGTQLIEMNILGPGVVLNQNNGENIVRGIEIALIANPVENLRTNLSYSYMSSDIDIPFSPNKFNYWINYTFRKVNVTFYGELIRNLFSSYQLNQLPPITTIAKMPNYSLLHFKMQYTINDHFNIGVGIENLTDENYYIITGYPMPGINFNMNVSVSY